MKYPGIRKRGASTWNFFTTDTRLPSNDTKEDTPGGETIGPQVNASTTTYYLRTVDCGLSHDRRTRFIQHHRENNDGALTSRMVFFTNSAKSGWMFSRPRILKRMPLKTMFSANTGVASGAKYEASVWPRAYLRTVSPSRVEGSTIFAGRDILLCFDFFVDLAGWAIKKGSRRKHRR